MNTFRLSWGELCGEYLSVWVINDQFQTIELQETKKRTSWRISDSFIPRRPTINTTNQRFVLSLSLCFSSSSKCFFKDLQTSPCPTNESTGKSESCYRFCLQKYLYEWKTSERTSVLHSPPFSKGKTVDSQDSSSVGVRGKFQNPQAREQRHIRASVTRTKEIETESIPAESIGNQKEILPSHTSLLSLLIDGQLSLTSPSPSPSRRSSFHSFVRVRIDQCAKGCSPVLFSCEDSFFPSKGQVRNEAIFVCILLFLQQRSSERVVRAMRNCVS